MVIIQLSGEQLESLIQNAVQKVISETNIKAAKHEEAEQWFNMEQLCQYHPDKPTKATVYGWVNMGIIPVHKGGKKLRFLKSEIDEWLRKGRKKTLAETAVEAENYIKKKKG